MRLRADGRQLGELSRENAAALRGAKPGLWRRVRMVSLSAERRIKNEMPVDTGRARASWGHWTPGDAGGDAGSNASDAQWEEKENDLSIEQGSNVEYVVYLNEGHSSQAPAGFIDMAAEKAQQDLDKEIDAELRRWGFS